MKTGLAAVAMIAGLGLGGTPVAATVVYSGTGAAADAANASFTSALTNVLTESFETYSSGAKPAVLTFTGANGSRTASLSGAGAVIGNWTRANPVPSGGYASDGSKFYSMEGSSFTISFANAVDALGFYASDIESDLTATLSLASGTTESYSFDSLFNSSKAASGTLNYLGFTSDVGILGITLSNFGRYDALAFDQFQIGNAIAAVPEVSTWGMMLIGMAGMGMMLRRRSTPRATSLVG